MSIQEADLGFRILFPRLYKALPWEHRGLLPRALLSSVALKDNYHKRLFIVLFRIAREFTRQFYDIMQAQTTDSTSENAPRSMGVVTPDLRYPVANMFLDG